VGQWFALRAHGASPQFASLAPPALAARAVTALPGEAGRARRVEWFHLVPELPRLENN
jgi:hypothetical protein